ncbi:PTS sugar transporter subunit IIB [Avibacterium paragallinarum]|uniref:PTS sugar transporter subunit IIB n=1 Tax=Avibacterium paragallinarum TaxID=728 RepID=UPI00397A0218
MCDMGMSTSLVVKKMNKIAKEKSLSLQIEAHGMQHFKELIQEFDCALLGP